MVKKVMGYTTGVYDMFHVGHLIVIQRAKEQCDYLVVGVGTDELVMKEKRKTSVIPFEERFAIISDLKYVDKVVPQSDKNKVATWGRYFFDKMFVGFDWKSSPQWLRFEEQFKPLYIEIVYLPHTDGISNTEMKPVIKNNLDELPNWGILYLCNIDNHATSDICCVKEAA